MLPRHVTLPCGEGSPGGYIFITWKGGHSPRHVPVYRDGKLVMKWGLGNKRTTKGKAPRKILGLIGELELKGLL